MPVYYTEEMGGVVGVKREKSLTLEHEFDTLFFDLSARHYLDLQTLFEFRVVEQRRDPSLVNIRRCQKTREKEGGYSFTPLDCCVDGH